MEEDGTEESDNEWLEEQTTDSEIDKPGEDKPDAPFHQLIQLIQNHTTAGTLGKPLLKNMAETEKNKLITKVLPTVLPVSKTVVEMTKTAIGHLVFTTHAMYWSKDGNSVKIPYAELQPEYLGTKLIKNTTVFVYAPPKRDEIIISVPDAEALERLLSEISTLGKYAESDVLTEFSSLPQAIQLTYMQLLASVIREGGYSLHEVYRLAVQDGLNEYWDCISAELELPFEDMYHNYEKQIPYPNEETVAISLLRDLCTVYQYTKDSDVLTVPEKKYFPIIFNGSTESRDAIIHYAQMEKQIIEQRIDAKSAQTVMNAFSVAAGAVGTSVLAYTGAMSLFMSTLWFNFIPGIGTLISAAVVGGSIVGGFLSSQNKKKLSGDETRQKMQDAIIQSYQKAEETATEQRLPEIANHLHDEAMRIAYQVGLRYAEYTEAEERVLDEIKQTIIEAIQVEKAEKSVFAKLPEDISGEVIKKIWANFGIKKQTISNLIAQYNTAFLRDDMGMLFTREYLYFRKTKTSPVQQMHYFNMQSVENQFPAPSIVIHGSNGDTMKIDGMNYCVFVPKSIEKIIKIVKVRKIIVDAIQRNHPI